MRDRKVVLSLILIMTGVSAVVGLIAIHLLYRTALSEDRAHLVETAQSQARLIEAVARFDAMYSTHDHPEGAEGATLSQFIDAHEHYEGFGKTGEFTLARREGPNMVFLVSHRHGDRQHPKPVPFDSSLAEPMRRSLSGLSGTVIGLDYRGVTVLAAHEPVAELNWGIVAKIDLAEVQAPFVRAGIVTGSAALAVVLVGAVLFIRVSDPLLRRIHESEARTRAIVETAADGIITISEKGVIETFNDAAERMFGYAARKVIGRDIKVLMPPAYHEGHEVRLKNYIETGVKKIIGAGPHELTAQRKDGTSFPIDLTVSEVHLGSRRIFTGIVRDITERKRVEETLRQNEEKLRAIFEQAAVGVAQIETATGRFARINDRYCDIVGITAEEMTATTFMAITHPDDLQADLDNMERLKAGKIRDFSIEKRYIRPDGSEVWVDLTVSPMWKAGQQPDYHIAVVEDISERKRAEEALQQAHEELEGRVAERTTELTEANEQLRREFAQRRRAEEAVRESEERHRALFEQAPDSILLIDTETGALVDFNQRAHENLGYTREEFQRLTIPDLEATESPVEIAEHIHRVMAAGFDTFETRHRTKTGQIRNILVSARVVSIQGRDFLQSICSDITEQRRLEGEILSVSRREQQRIGHDLHDVIGQRLTGIAFLAKVLEQRLAGRSPPEAGKALQIERMSNDAITQARALAKGLCPVDLQADGLMAALLEHAVHVETLFGVKCRFHCRRSLLVHDDAAATHLYRIAQEAVNNAVKHGRAQCIDIGMDGEDGRLTLTIKDDGEGLPDTFEKSDGMGLHIMKYRARMIGAVLDIHRDPDGGTALQCTFQSDAVSRGDGAV